MKLRSFKVSAGQAPVSKTGVAVARFGLIDRIHSLRWASPRNQCVYITRLRRADPTLRPDRWLLSVCSSEEMAPAVTVLGLVHVHQAENFETGTGRRNKILHACMHN